MSASEGLQSLFSYRSNPVLPHLVSSWECLEMSASLSISWTTLYCMVLVSSCRSLSLAHFLPRTLDSLLFLGWHILSVVVTFYLMFWDMFIDYAHFFIFFTYHGLDISFFGWVAWFYFQPDFHYKKVKGKFSHSHHFFEMFAFTTWSFFYIVYLSRAQYLILCLILDSFFDLMLIFSL